MCEEQERTAVETLVPRFSATPTPSTVSPLIAIRNKCDSLLKYSEELLTTTEKKVRFIVGPEPAVCKEEKGAGAGPDLVSGLSYLLGQIKLRLSDINHQINRL